MTQPTTLAEVSGTLSSVAGIYEVDQQALADGLQYFRNDQFVEARAALERADPARRDALTQYYIAYSFYRQGWGRLYSDDALFREGLAAVERAIALVSGFIERPASDRAFADLKVGLYIDRPRGLVHDLYLHGAGAGNRVCQAIGPFDRQYTIGRTHLLEADVLRRRLLQPVEIGVIKNEPSSSILVNQCKRGAGDLLRIDAEPRGDAAHKGSLACAKMSGDEQHVTSRER